MPESPQDRLHQLPRAGLGFWPTPLHRLDRFSEAVGAEVWIKRDDVQGVALAGNKIRKFDLVLGQALTDGFDTLVTTGAIQSNSARTGAAAAAATGMDCVLILQGSEPTEPYANLLIDRLVGADVRFAGPASWAELNDMVDAVVVELAERGRRALAAPVGCSSPLGSLGFAAAFAELEAQAASMELAAGAIVHTSTSGGTHAGLLIGRALAESTLEIIGVDAGRLYPNPERQATELATEGAALIGFDLGISAVDVRFVHDQVGPGYGIPTDEADHAIHLLARTEGIIVDPVYSAKGLAGLMALIREERFSGPFVFWHTGGFHALFDPHYGTSLVG